MISIFLYGIFAIIILSKAGMPTFIPNNTVVNVGIWVLAVYFAVGVIMNGISRSKPERNLMTPIALVLAITTCFIALS
ncbi:MAG: putative rane protein [Candidatus Saccharibacteria bacterium]|nr:putative rane protein [Candidatus Saccharibacteria bacterium]